MSRLCELTGTRPKAGNKVSHSNIKTRTRWLPNVKKKKFVIPELGQAVTITVTTGAIRTIDKQGGITNALMKAKTDKLSPRLLKLRNQITKKRQTAAATPAKK